MILVGGIASAIVGLILSSPESRIIGLTILLNSIDSISMTLSTGLFSFLTAGLLFNSQASRQYLLQRIKMVGSRRAFLTRVLHTIAITSLFTTVLVTLSFINSLLLGQFSMSLSPFVFLPSILGASLVGSILLSAISSLTDDSRLSVLLGCASTLMIANVAGWSSEYYRYHITRNIV